MKLNYTHLVILIDRSGSMQSIKQDMEGGLNEFLTKQKEVEGTCTVTVAQFDDQFDITNDFDDISLVKEVVIEPRGMTALTDAMCKLIDKTGRSLAALREEDRPEKVIFLVITDGYENASREFSTATLKEKVKHQEDTYKWDFVYLGANQDALLESQKYGFTADSSMTYMASTDGVNALFSQVSSSVTMSRSTKAKLKFTKEQQDEVKNS